MENIESGFTSKSPYLPNSNPGTRSPSHQPSEAQKKVTSQVPSTFASQEAVFKQYHENLRDPVPLDPPHFNQKVESPTIVDGQAYYPYIFDDFQDIEELPPDIHQLILAGSKKVMKGGTVAPKAVDSQAFKPLSKPSKVSKPATLGHNPNQTIGPTAHNLNDSEFDLSIDGSFMPCYPPDTLRKVSVVKSTVMQITGSKRLRAYSPNLPGPDIHQETTKRSTSTEDALNEIQSKRREDDVEELAVAIPKGIPNIVNSCYLNSAIQFLLAIPGWEQRLTSLANNELTTVCLNNVVSELKTNRGHAGLHLLMETFRHAVFRSKVYDLETNGAGLLRQQDPAQLIEYILTLMGEAIRAERSWTAPGNAPNRVTEFFPMLQVPLQADVMMLSAQNLCNGLFETIDKIDPQNPLQINGVSYSRYQERLQLLEPPPSHLILHFKRFDYRNGSVAKLDNFIQMPPNLQIDLSKAFGDNPLVEARYRITAALIHESFNQNSDIGHHKTMVKRSDSWYDISDTDVTRVTTPQDQIGKGYLWLLQKVD